MLGSEAKGMGGRSLEQKALVVIGGVEDESR